MTEKVIKILQWDSIGESKLKLAPMPRSDDPNVIQPEVIPKQSGFYYGLVTIENNKEGIIAIECTACKGKSIIAKSSLSEWKCLCQRPETRATWGKGHPKFHWICAGGHHNFTDYSFDTSRYCLACEEFAKEKESEEALKRSEPRRKKFEARVPLWKIEEDREKELEKKELDKQANANAAALKPLFEELKKELRDNVQKRSTPI